MCLEKVGILLTIAAVSLINSSFAACAIGDPHPLPIDHLLVIPDNVNDETVVWEFRMIPAENGVPTVAEFTNSVQNLGTFFELKVTRGEAGGPSNVTMRTRPSIKYMLDIDGLGRDPFSPEFMVTCEGGETAKLDPKWKIQIKDENTQRSQFSTPDIAIEVNLDEWEETDVINAAVKTEINIHDYDDTAPNAKVNLTVTANNVNGTGNATFSWKQAEPQGDHTLWVTKVELVLAKDPQPQPGNYAVKLTAKDSIDVSVETVIHVELRSGASQTGALFMVTFASLVAASARV